MKNKQMKNKTRKKVPWAGWHKHKPTRTKQRREMYKKCGKHCFLGTKQSFPICKKNTCRRDKKGIWSAYIRARSCANPHSGCRTRANKSKSTQYYTNIANKAKRLL